MIPMNMQAMLIGSMIFMLSLVSLGLLIVCLLALLIPRFRRYMLARPRRFGLLVIGLAVVSAPVVTIVGKAWLDERAHHPRLDHEEVLGELVLPAGTQVRLEYRKPFNDLSGDPMPYGMQSLKHADFDRAPGNILGMRVRRLALWQDHGNATVETMAAADVQGWRCEPGKVEFRFPFGAHFTLSKWRLEGCMLAPGSTVGGIVWPGPVKVFSTKDGEWNVASDDTPTRLLGLELRPLSMRLNGPHGDVVTWSGVLDHALDVGPIHYAAGIEVRSYQGHLLFIPRPETPAVDTRTSTPIEQDHSVVQNVTGEMLGVRPNHEVGIRNVDELLVPDELVVPER
jgi:hypothetical protein